VLSQRAKVGELFFATTTPQPILIFPIRARTFAWRVYACTIYDTHARQGFLRVLFLTRLGRFHHHDNFAAFARTIHTFKRDFGYSVSTLDRFRNVICLSLARASGESLVAG